MSRLSFVEDKIVSLELAKFRVNTWNMKGEKVVFTNGCFDILHKGHVSYLAKAAAYGSKLIVGINTDDSVKRQNKAPNRPINDEVARALVLASLGFIDLVVLFDGDTPLDLILELKPDVLLKGADYDPAETNPSAKSYIVGSDFVKNNGGEVGVIALEEGFSTTSLISKMKALT